MPRTVQITVASSQSERLISRIQQMDGVVGVRLQREIARNPPGDVISVEILNTSLAPLMTVLDEEGIGKTEGTSFTTSTPTTVVSSKFTERLAADASEQTWEEIESQMGRESNMTPNGLLLMALSGVVATIGVSSGAIHVVVGAMVIAPGFEPITRIGFGLASGSAAVWRGLRHTAYAYVTLFVAALATAFALRLLNKPVLSEGDTYLATQSLVAFWTSITVKDVIVTISASIAGAILVASGRSVLTAGVMIALALIPSAAIAAMALVAGQWAISGRAGVRWLMEVGCVLVFGLAVFLWKRSRVHRRDAML